MNRDYGKKCSAPTAVKRMADGGTVGFWERIKAGNIDEVGSEAYNRWGAGAKAAPAPAPTPEPVSRPQTPYESASMAEANAEPQGEADYSNESRRTVVPAKKAAPIRKPAPVARVGTEKGRATLPSPDQSAAETKRLASRPVPGIRRVMNAADPTDNNPFRGFGEGVLDSFTKRFGTQAQRNK